MENVFSFAPTPQLYFGPGKITVLSSAIRTFGPVVLLVTGARSFLSSPNYFRLLDEFRSNGISVEQYCISGEPSPDVIDTAVKRFSSFSPNVILAIGGGSVLDAGKAIAAMLPLREPVKNYLEGVGNIDHPGRKIPFVAVPTTSGTGSEATKNAVLSEVGETGFKRSLRHNNFVPNVSVVDPILTVSCSPATTAASGMDAFTQLLESYVSRSASPMTDALAYEGLKHVSASLRQSYRDGSNIFARTGMSLASYLSGITLANAGLGVIHGFASAIGGYFPLAHGVICSCLMAPANKITVRKLRLENGNPDALKKYTEVGKLFVSTENKSDDYYIDSLLDTIESWTSEMNIPRLNKGGVFSTHFAKIVSAAENKNNPVPLNNEEMLEVLELAR
jgi:alcohol dehydrogenase class IV